MDFERSCEKRTPRQRTPPGFLAAGGLGEDLGNTIPLDLFRPRLSLKTIQAVQTQIQSHKYTMETSNCLNALGLAICAAFITAASSAPAQQITGVPGSPSATTTISGKQLPPPDPKFGGVIKMKATESKPWWPPRVVPPKGAPNVLLIMTDDCGFGSPSTFGGVIPTPALDRIAKNGLRYTQFHSTSLCSPTRAALITGRNHHVNGYGVGGEAATGFPVPARARKPGRGLPLRGAGQGSGTLA